MVFAGYPASVGVCRQTDPGRRRGASEEFIVEVQILRAACIGRPFAAISLKADLRKCQRQRPLLTGNCSFQPVQADQVFAALRRAAQCQKRPRRRNQQRLAGNSVDQRISAVPSPVRDTCGHKALLQQTGVSGSLHPEAVVWDTDPAPSALPPSARPNCWCPDSTPNLYRRLFPASSGGPARAAATSAATGCCLAGCPARASSDRRQPPGANSRRRAMSTRRAQWPKRLPRAPLQRATSHPAIAWRVGSREHGGRGRCRSPNPG